MFCDILYSIGAVRERITSFDLVQYNWFIFQKDVKARNPPCLVYILDELLETLK